MTRQLIADCNDCRKEQGERRKSLRLQATNLLKGCRDRRIELGLTANSDEWQDEWEFDVERFVRETLELLKTA
jgi:hypothetical protein